jgi:monoamine oxidase
MASPIAENPRLEFLRAELRTIFGADLLGRLPVQLPEERGKVCVVGAGFAGLATAYFLVHLGYSVVVFEAHDRVGGRVFTDRSFLGDAHIERGAELIGDNHVVWLGLAAAFGLGFTRLDTHPDDPTRRPLRLDRTVYLGEDAKRIWDGVDAACRLLDPEAEQVTSPYRPWDPDKNPVWLDGLSLGERLDEMEGEFTPDIWPTVRLALEGLFSNDNVVSTYEQSLLGILAQVSGGGPEGGFWDDSETQRCAEGNDALATCLANELAARAPSRAELRTETDVSAILNAPMQAGVVSDGTEELCDYVVLTAPPSVWDRIKTTDEWPLPAGMQQGSAIKVFSEVKTRFWERNDEDAEGMAVSSDGSTGGGETWDGTAGQPDPVPELSVFAGGPAASAALEKLAEGEGVLYGWYEEALDALFPGYAENVEERTHQAWPLVDWICTGYSSPAPGQVTAIAPDFARPHGRMIIAGEQTCPAFIGFMEGALESGLIAAALLRSADSRDDTYDRVADALDRASTKPARQRSV